MDERLPPLECVTLAGALLCPKPGRTVKGYIMAIPHIRYIAIKNSIRDIRPTYKIVDTENKEKTTTVKGRKDTLRTLVHLNGGSEKDFIRLSKKL